MDRWYPSKIVAHSLEEFVEKKANHNTEGWLASRLESLFSRADKTLLNIAEFGIWRGFASIQLADFLSNKGSLHIFDYADTVEDVHGKLQSLGFTTSRLGEAPTDTWIPTTGGSRL